MATEITEKKQDKRKSLPQLFKKGQSGNPKGRPVGSISIVGRIKQIFEQEPERFESYVKGVLDDEKLRKEVIQQIDGSPAQKLDLTSGGEKLTFGVINFDDYDSSQSEAQ